MRIWHAELIPKLCQKHLCAMWREGLGAYKIITENKKGYRNHPATQEFIDAPVTLLIRLSKVRLEMLKRGYHPKDLPFLPHNSLNENPYLETIHEWQSLDEQIQVLKSKNCKCNIQ